MKKQNEYNVTFGGIGGQGIIKASELVGWAAMYEGFHVKKSEVHGMSQRGGSVESHVRFGKASVISEIEYVGFTLVDAPTVEGLKENYFVRFVKP